ncbi:serine hydrolase domain-containing protein [Legionella sp. CNM-1927-20]|uniref:serine hydrolase domain-containing protein n=1 Tax=Legionella sp. CNM-1927-20 TaxID=3422221 RepID=UPI00403AAD2D
MPNPSVDTLQKITVPAHIPAISYAYVEPKEQNNTEFESTAIAFGKKNADSPATDVNNNTQFPASSLSKIVFTYLVLQWAEENKIKLDKPIYEIVKEKQFEVRKQLDEAPKETTQLEKQVKQLDNVLEYERFVDKGKYPEQAKKLTIKHVLSHTTGLPNVGVNPHSTLAFNSEPGEEYSYSGESFLYLQKVLEATTGKNLEELAKQYMFDPLEMENSTFLPQSENTPTIVKVHTELGQPKNIYIGDPPVHAAGSLITTAQDFSKLMVAWLKNMGDAFKPTSADSFPTCGLGWHIYNYKNKDNKDEIIAYQYGENPNTKSFVAINVTHKKGAVFFTNSENGMRIANELFSSADLAPIGNTEELFKRMPNYPQGCNPVWQNTLEGLIAENQGKFDLARDKFTKALEFSNNHESTRLRLEWFNQAHPPTSEEQTFEKPLQHFEGMLTNKYNEQRRLFIREGNLIQEQFGKEIKLVRVSETDFLPEKDQSFRIRFNGNQVIIDFIEGPPKQFDNHPLQKSQEGLSENHSVNEITNTTHLESAREVNQRYRNVVDGVRNEADTVKQENSSSFQTNQ